MDKSTIMRGLLQLASSTDTMELMCPIGTLLENLQAAVSSLHGNAKGEGRIELEARAGSPASEETGDAEAFPMLHLRTKTEDGWLERRLRVSSVKTAGRVVVPADRLLRLIKSLEHEHTVHLKRDAAGGPIVIRPALSEKKAPKRKFTLLADERAELEVPMPAVLLQPEWSLESGATWKKLVAGGAYARSTDKNDAIVFQSVLLEASAAETRLVSTDRTRLATSWVTREGAAGTPTAVLISGVVLDTLGRQIDATKPLRAGGCPDAPNTFAWAQDDFTFVAFVTQGEFPKWRLTIPTLKGDSVRRLRVAKPEFVELLRQLRALTSDNPDDPKRVEFHLDVSSSARVQTPGAGEGEISEIQALTFEGLPGMLPLDLDCLEPAIAAMPDQSRLRFGFLAVDKAVLIEPDAPEPGAVQLQAIVAPLKQATVKS